MTTIFRAEEKDAALVSTIAIRSFTESHGSSASEEDIAAYAREKYNTETLRQELLDPGNYYHILRYQNEAAGYSKLRLSTPYPNAPVKNIAKLERIYLLSIFYGLKLGSTLLQANIRLAKQQDQAGLWLYVWKGNERAIGFYTKAGFHVTGSYDFPISSTHTNPNHQMFLAF